MNFPESLKVEDLQQVHPDYQAALIKQLHAYWKGGITFPVSDELRRKPVEQSQQFPLIAAAMRTCREDAAFYTAYLRDALEDLIADICKDPLEISDEKERPYWNQLTGCTDGSYTSATQQARCALADDFLYSRAAYCISFPPTDKKADNLQSQLDGGELDALINHVCARKLNDWQEDGKGGLLWARTYEIEPARSTAWGPYDKDKHTWTYYATDSVVSYIATTDRGKGFEKEATATRQTPEVHSLGVCPIFRVERRFHSWVGQKLLPTAKQLFNEESDASFYQFTTITGGLIVFAEDKNAAAAGLMLTPFGAPILGVNDKIERDKCDASALQALKAASAERRGQLRGLIHEEARQTGAQSASGQNTSRASGSAIKAHRDPLAAWLLGFAEAQLSTWRRMIAAIAKMRDEGDEDITVTGLMGSIENEDDAAADPMKMQAVTAFMALPFVADEAKEAYGRRLGAEVNMDEDEDTLEEIKNAKIEKPEPPAPPPITSNPNPITVATATGKPAPAPLRKSVVGQGAA